MSRTTYIALLRGINVSGHHLIPMAELRPLCQSLGWQNVQTYIQSGNVVFTATAAPVALEGKLELAITRKFGFTIPTVVRSASDWSRYVRLNPFPQVAAAEPNRIMLALSKVAPLAGALAGLHERCTHGETVLQTEEAFWIHYSDGVANSKLSPALFDRLAGSPVTARNWRTVLKLAALAG